MLPLLPHHRRAGFAAWAATLALVAGCDDGRPAMDTSRAEVKVSGTVRIKGKLVDGGEIVFDPSNAERQVGAFTGKVGPDGTFAMTTYRGANVVKFRGEMLKATPELALTSRYFEAKAGENVVDFDLLGETDQARGSIYSRKKPAAKKR